MTTYFIFLVDGNDIVMDFTFLSDTIFLGNRTFSIRVTPTAGPFRLVAANSISQGTIGLPLIATEVPTSRTFDASALYTGCPGPGQPPTFSKAFTPNNIVAGSTSTLRFTIDNSASNQAVTTLAFTDTLPAAITVANPANASSTCGSAAINAASGTSVVGWDAGLAIPANSSCTVQVDVTSTTLGAHVNATGGLGTSQGLTGTATQTLTVVGGLTLVKSFTDDPVLSGAVVTLQFTITNTDAVSAATNLAFTDDLDAALTGLAAVGLPAANVCGSGSQITGTSFLALTGGTLAAGASCTFAVTLQVPANASGTHTNTTSEITGTIAGTAVTGAAARDDLVITEVVQQTLTVIRNFLTQRADLITSHDPLLTPHLNGTGTDLTDTAVNFTGGGVPGALELAFSTSLSQMARAREGERARKRPELSGSLAPGHAKATASGTDGAPPFDIWLRGTFANYRDTGGGVDEDGTFRLLYVGGEYRAAAGLLVGVLAQFDWSDEKDERTGIATEGQGWMVGPYVVARPARRVFAQARAAWGRSENAVSPFGTYTDSFDTSRWLASAKVEGRFIHGAWRISPIGSIIYFEDEHGSYTDTLGNLIPSQTVSLGRMTFGPQIAYAKPMTNGRHVAVFAEGAGIWDFDVEDRVVSGLFVGSDDLRAKLTGGITLRGRRHVRVNVSGFIDGVGADNYKAYGGNLKIGMPLN